MRRPFALLVGSLVVVAGLSTLAGPAAAQSAATQADALFKQGRAQMAAGNLEAACTAFDSSQQLDPAVTTLLNLADCREKRGQLATAWGLFVEAERQLRGAPAAQKAMAKTAVKRAAKLEPRLSKLTIAVAADRRLAGLEILRGSDPVASGAWNQALPIDGGSYQITARAPGHRAWTGEVTVKREGDTQRIEIPRLTAEPVATPTPRPVVAGPTRPPVEGPSATPDPAPRTPPARAGRSKLPGITLLVVGGAALAGSGVFGKLAYDKWSAAEDVCGGSRECPDAAATKRANELSDASQQRGWISTGLGAAGVAAVAVGVVLLVRSGGGGESEDDREERAGLHLAPALGSDAAGAVVWGRW